MAPGSQREKTEGLGHIEPFELKTALRSLAQFSYCKLTYKIFRFRQPLKRDPPQDVVYLVLVVEHLEQHSADHYSGNHGELAGCLDSQGALAVMITSVVPQCDHMLCPVKPLW